MPSRHDVFVTSPCGWWGRWQQASQLLREARRVGLEPDVVSYSGVITACEKCGQWQQALSLLEEMCKAGVSLDMICFNAAIPA